MRKKVKNILLRFFAVICMAGVISTSGVMGLMETQAYADSDYELTPRNLGGTNHNIVPGVMGINWKNATGCGDTFADGLWDIYGVGYGSGISFSEHGFNNVYWLSDTNGVPAGMLPYKPDNSSSTQGNGNTMFLKQGSTTTRVEMRLSFELPEEETYKDWMYLNIDVYNGESTTKYFSYSAFCDAYYYSDSCPILIDSDHDKRDIFKCTWNGTTFDCITKNTEMGVDGFNHMWVGHYGSAVSAAWNVNEGTDGYTDTGYALSIISSELKPHETKHYRVAFAEKNKVYYVNQVKGQDNNSYSSSDGYSGDPKHPFKTIQYAIDKIGNNKGYIYIQNDASSDYENSIAYNIQDGTTAENINFTQGDITLLSADLDLDGDYADNLGSNIIHRTSENEKDNPGIYYKKINVGSKGKITISGSAQVTFKDISFVGRDTAPLDDANKDNENNHRQIPFIDLQGGTLTFEKGTTFDNIKTMKKAAVIEATTGNLNLNGVTVKNCVSAADKGAIYINSNNVSMKSANIIKGNTSFEGRDAAGNIKTEPSNVFLADGKVLKVSGILQRERIKNVDPDDPASPNYVLSDVGVSLQTYPTTYSGEGAYTSAHEKVIVEHDNEPTNPYYGDSDCMFVKYFFADTRETGGTKTARGSADFSYNKKVVMTKSGYSMDFSFVDENGVDIVEGSGAGAIKVSKDPISFSNGENVFISSPSNADPTISNYNIITDRLLSLDRVEVSNVSLIVDNDKNSPTFGQIQGTMPKGAVSVKYHYKPKETSIIFNTNGSNMTIDNYTGVVGNPVIGVLPSPTKRGYLFNGVDPKSSKPTGWYSTSNFDGSPLSSLPPQYEANDINLYAKYRPDPNFVSPLTVKYTNLDGSQVYGEAGAAPFGVEAELDISPANIEGYIVNQSACKTNPEKYIYGDGIERNLADWFDSNGRFVGNGVGSANPAMMPGDNLELSIAYEPDPSATYDLKVIHKRANGSVISTEGPTAKHINESFTVNPLSTDGYTILSNIIASGSNASSDPIIFAVTGNWNNVSKSYTGFMPNQDVTIEYTYNIPLNSSLITNYKDINSNDENFKNIYDGLDIINTSEGDALSKEPREIYGYAFNDSAGEITDCDPAGQMTYNSSNEKFEGIAINGAITLNMHYNRVPEKFKTITYKTNNDPQITGAYTLDNTSINSPDLTTDTPNTQFSAEVLAKTTGIGGGNGWTWAKIKNGKLKPTVQISDTDYFEFTDEWFIDKDGDQIYNASVDQLLTDSYVFTEDVVVIPKIGKNLAHWASVTFTVGEHGHFTGTTPTQNEFKYNDTWEDINNLGLIPNVSVDYGYVVDGWYNGSAKITDPSTTYMTNGATYTAKIIARDYNILKTPQANASLDPSGKAQIILYDTSSSFRYVVANSSNEIVAKKEGSTSVRFNSNDGLLLNNIYNIYETKDTFASINIGDNISTLVEKCITAKTCFIPAVIKNYTVTFDTSTITSGGTNNIAKLVINPADTSYQYALYEGASPVAGCDFTSGSSITFEGLVPGKSYKVMTEKGGIIATAGTIISIDNAPQAANEYAVYVIGGTANGADHLAATPGTSITLSSSITPFQKWEVLTGGISVSNSASATFTMPSSNVVVRAKRQTSASDTHKQKLTEDIEGEGNYKIASDISDDQTLIGQLVDDATHSAEDYLTDHGFNIEYKIRYNKRELSDEEQSSLLTTDASRAAFAVDFDVNRYLQGYRIDTADPFNDYNYIDYIPPLTLSNPQFMNALRNANPLLNNIEFNDDGTYNIIENNHQDETASESEAIEETNCEEEATTAENETEETNEETSADDATTIADEIETEEAEIEESTEVEEIESNEEIGETENIVTDDETTIDEETLLDDGVEANGPASIEEYVESENETYEEEPEEDSETAEDICEEEIESDEDVEDDEELEDTEEENAKNEENTTIDTSIDNTDSSDTYEEVTSEDINEETIEEETVDESEIEEMQEELSEDVEDEIVNDEEVEENTNDIVGFADTYNEDVPLEVYNLANNISILGSSYTNPTITIPTVLILDADDTGMQDYKLYKDGTEDTTADLTNAPKGVIKFNAENGHTYILTYNRVATITFTNDSPNNPMTNKTQKIRKLVGDTINLSELNEALVTTYTVGRARYFDGAWTYKKGNPTDPSIVVNDGDTVYANMTIYASYNTDAETAADAEKQLADLLEKVKHMLDINKFLTQEEWNTYNAAYQVAKAVYDNPVSSIGDIQNAYTPLLSAYNVANSLINPREEIYENELARAKSNQSGSYGAGGGGGGAGGGGGGAGGGGGGGLGIGAGLGAMGTQNMMTPLGVTLGEAALMGEIQPTSQLNQQNLLYNYVINGSIIKNTDIFGRKDFVKQNGERFANSWVQDTDGSWYHYNKTTLMDAGWFLDETNTWYHSENLSNENYGKMSTGIFSEFNPTTNKNNMYYFEKDGKMVVGWKAINNNLYYFNTGSSLANPYGSMLTDTITPDGWQVNAIGQAVAYVGGRR